MRPYNRALKPISRQLRANQTEYEKRLWTRLRRKQILGVQFYRQKTLGNFIVDFYAPKAKLVIEVDGAHHNQENHREKDAVRDACLEAQDLIVLRFTNDQVSQQLDSVMTSIFRTVQQRLNTPE